MSRTRETPIADRVPELNPVRLFLLGLLSAGDLPWGQVECADSRWLLEMGFLERYQPPELVVRRERNVRLSLDGWALLSLLTTLKPGSAEAPIAGIVRDMAQPDSSPLNEQEERLLIWLGEADSSSLGECDGAVLNVLRARGLVTIAEAPGKDRNYDRVSLSESGIAELVAVRARRDKERR